MEPLLNGFPDKRPPPLERILDNVNQNINALISTLDGRQPLLRGNFLMKKGWPRKRGSTVPYQSINLINLDKNMRNYIKLAS